MSRLSILSFVAGAVLLGIAIAIAIFKSENYERQKLKDRKIYTVAVKKVKTDFKPISKSNITKRNQYLFSLIRKLKKIKAKKNTGIDYTSLTKILNFSPDSIGYNSKEPYDDKFKPKQSKDKVYIDYCKQNPNDTMCKPKKLSCKDNNLLPGCQNKKQITEIKELIKKRIIKNSSKKDILNLDALLFNINDIIDLLNIYLMDIRTVQQLIQLLYSPTLEDRWKTGTSSLNGRVKMENAYYGEWSVSTIVRDSQYDMFGNDMYGLLSIGDNMSRTQRAGRYIFAGWENRMDLINTRRSENLGFGRPDTTTLDYGPECANDDTEVYGKFGQGTEVRPKNNEIWTCYPIKNCPGQSGKTIISFRKGKLTEKIPPSSLRSGNSTYLTNHTIIKDENGNIISYGIVNSKADWIAYDTLGQFICVPNDLELEYLDIYTYEHDELDNFILQKVNRAYFWQGRTDENEGLAGDGAKITAGTFGNDGLLYLLCDDAPIRWPYFSSFRGILVYRPMIIEGDWKLVLVRQISFDVEGDLVGLTKVDSPLFLNISRTPLLVAMELNEDVLTLDNVSLHQITPIDVVCPAVDFDNNGNFIGVADRCSFGTFLDTESILEDWGCGIGIVLYNLFRSINYLSTTTETPYTLKRTDNRSMQLFSGFRDYLEQVLQLDQDIDLDQVEIYDNMCLIGNWGREYQGTRAMCMGYTVYFQNKITETRNNVTKLRGEFLNTLIHELAHTRQFVQLGESHYNFGCSYGIGVCDSIDISGSSYVQVYMEEEARYVYTTYLINQRIAQTYNMNIWPNSFDKTYSENC